MESTAYDFAATARATATSDPDALVYRVVDVKGFSSRFSSDLAIRSGAERLGEVLGGLATAQLADAAPGLASVAVGDHDAQRAGLSCGGQARVLVQPLAAVPTTFWELLERREPALLVTRIDADGLGATTVVGEDGVAGVEAAHPGAARLFARGATGAAVVDEATLLSAYWPRPRLVVVGTGELADALARLGEELHWSVDIQTAPSGLDDLGSADAVVILSHDRAVDIPALTQGLAGRVGYIGGLGSRRTQANRAEALAALGVDPGARIHGPAGLDIGAYTSPEIAVSIVAEIMAVRAGTTAQSISARISDTGGGVHA
jgi:xanthine dehydrogenase accessory factor